MNIREFYNVLLVRMNFREVLPSAYVKRKKIQECNEEIVLLNSPNIMNGCDDVLCGRKTVVSKLENVANKLESEGLCLMIYELFRSKEKQHKLRMVQKNLLQQRFPDLSEQELLLQLDKRVASEGGGHRTGGAVDLTICDCNGKPLDMGTSYEEFNKSTPTGSDSLTEEQKHNRCLLQTVMKNEGFVNYPLEWWHYSYGDKMWASYLNKPHAIYGNVNQYS
jgi:D-alanyl-D-alanine dipeptidase